MVPVAGSQEAQRAGRQLLKHTPWHSQLAYESRTYPDCTVTPLQDATLWTAEWLGLGQSDCIRCGTQELLQACSTALTDSSAPSERMPSPCERRAHK